MAGWQVKQRAQGLGLQKSLSAVELARFTSSTFCIG